MDITTIGRYFLLVLVACGAHATVSSSSLHGNETDRLSLLAFKEAIGLDPQQVFMSWNDSTHFCNWEGVMCNVKTPQRVIKLNLTSGGLVGNISPSLGNLSFLHSLSLTENTLTGEIPPSLGHLRRLRNLRLSNNTLQGRIPSFTNKSMLRLLDVSNNNLVGQIPTDLPPLLQVLDVSFNNLTSSIPASLANITTLTTISCPSNHIYGNIPAELADLRSLQYLYMGSNQLTGRFPQFVSNLSTLIGLDLVLNDLKGEVPPNLGTSLPNLQILSLGGNFFEGHIPTSITNASSLNVIDLSVNKFNGIVPRMIGQLTKLSELNVGKNQIQAHSKDEWEFLGSLCNCTELRVLSMSYNHLSGHVPSSLGNISNQLQVLQLAGNQLSGEFPPGIANMHNLFLLALGKNRFTGVVPEWIGTLKTLQKINLYSNFFTGVIPSSLSNLSQLGWLFLHSNQFIGHIPPSFGNFQMLQYLEIAHNNLYGSVPVEIFRIPTIFHIDLSFNKFDGKLPTGIGKAKQLTNLGLSSNKISGDIPNTISDCESLEDIELDSNNFSGSIPNSLGKLTGLRVLNLSTNNLNGIIPVSLANLQLIEKLDLSFNHLYGEVPTKGIFKNASVVRIIGNQGLCGGAIELHILACVVIPSEASKHTKSLLLKVLIPVAGMFLLCMVIFGLFIYREKHKRKSISLPTFAPQFPKVSFNNLSTATEGFSIANLVGRGRYSSVYQGKLVQHENRIAVKVFNLETRGAEKSFIAECNALRNLRHRNLVPILTVCSSIDHDGNDFKALVYEFMPQGDLHKLLYSSPDYIGSSGFNHLTMAQRMDIVVDVADAMDYLHHNSQGTMVHCDLKPSNILTDDNMIAHVGDFGLARFKAGSTTSSLTSPNSSSVGLLGTIGYAAPEYAGGGQVSTVADVYSFGVVLLEIFLRRRPTDDMFKDGVTIVKFTETNFPDNVLEVVDPQLRQELELCQETPMALKEKGVRSLLSMLSIGLSCTKPSPAERIDMHEVAAKLHGIRDAYLRGNGRGTFLPSVAVGTQ